MEISLWEFLSSRMTELGIKTWEHLILVGVSMGIAVSFGIPLGIIASKTQWLRQVVLSVAGIVQTIPSLAILALFLPFLGIGTQPAIAALVLYALLPIIRNTCTGIDGIDPPILEAADGMGFDSWQRLRMVEIPLALPVIIAGIRTSTVICVGIATLAAFIGAGGLGDFIVTGLSMNNQRLILLGAIPAGILALVLDGIIGFIEKQTQWGTR